VGKRLHAARSIRNKHGVLGFGSTHWSPLWREPAVQECRQQSQQNTIGHVTITAHVADEMNMGFGGDVTRPGACLDRLGYQALEDQVCNQKSQYEYRVFPYRFPSFHSSSHIK